VTIAEQFDGMGLDASYDAYLATARGRLLKLGRKLSLAAVFAAAVPKAADAERDGVALKEGWCIEVFAVPRGAEADTWAAEMKASLRA
jgi:hypothetical protein